MRYPINQGLKNKVSLAEEVTFVEHYIALQKLRLGEDYPVIFEKKGNLDSFFIIPFVLMPLVENAFKYGISQKNRTPVIFRLSIQNKRLTFSTENAIVRPKDLQSHLVGIKNLKTRLHLVYSQNYLLEHTQSNGIYLVNLQLTSLNKQFT